MLADLSMSYQPPIFELCLYATIYLYKSDEIFNSFDRNISYIDFHYLIRNVGNET